MTRRTRKKGEQSNVISPSRRSCYEWTKRMWFLIWLKHEHRSISSKKHQCFEEMFVELFHDFMFFFWIFFFAIFIRTCIIRLFSALITVMRMRNFMRFKKSQRLLISNVLKPLVKLNAKNIEIRWARKSLWHGIGSQRNANRNNNKNNATK